jgi:predicted ATPase
VHYVHDPKIYALAYLAVIDWIQGYPDRARRWSAEAIEWAQELNNANMTAFTQIYGAAGLYELMRDVEHARPHIETIVEITEAHSLHYFRLSGVILRGWALTMDGDEARGIAVMQETIGRRGRMGVGWYQARYLLMLAEACIQQGDVRAAAEFVARAKEHMTAHDERMWEAEAYRIDAEVKRLEGAADDVIEACFARALATSREQEAKSFELRAAVSFAEYLRDRGRRGEALSQLAPVLAWFSEGHDTVDLRRAAQLQRELS